MGSNFVRYLYNKYPDYYLVNLDLLTYAGNKENLLDLDSSKRYNFIQGDIGDGKLVNKVLKKYKFDVVINFAAESHVDRSIIDSSRFIDTNVKAAHVLLDAVHRRKVPRFVYISTDEIYGDVPLGIKTSESHPISPTNPYAASKASADVMVQAYIKTHKLPALIIRSSNNFGPYQYPEKLIPVIITSIIEDKKIPVHGNGKQIRSWVHVSDFCKAVDMMIHKAEDFKIYNINGEEKSNIEVISLIAKTLGVRPEKYIKYINDRPYSDARYSPDSTKIKKELGWECSISFDDSLKDLTKWYLDNKGWWQKIKSKQEFRNHYEKQLKGDFRLRNK